MVPELLLHVKGRGGRPRKPAELHLLTGTFRPDRHAGTGSSRFTPSARQRATWLRHAQELESYARRMTRRAYRGGPAAPKLLALATRFLAAAEKIWARLERHGGPPIPAPAPPSGGPRAPRSLAEYRALREDQTHRGGNRR